MTIPLKIESVQNPQSKLYRLSVTDRMGVQMIDFEDFDSAGIRKEGGSLAISLRAKGYDVTVVQDVTQNP